MTDRNVKQTCFSPAEVAIILGVSEQTVWRMMREGELKTVKVGKRRKVHQSTIDEYLGLS